MKKKISILVLFLLVFSVYAQRRTLEVTKPRMNGDDVKKVQKELVELGFTEVGEIDGYYGPKSEGAVKELKSLIGFPVNGYVNEYLYDFLESKDSDLIFDAIKVYNQNKNKSEQIVYEEGYDFYSRDVKIFELSDSSYFFVETESTAYNPDGGGLDPWDTTAEYEYRTNYTSYITIGKDLFKLKEGKLEKAEEADFYINLINDYKENNRYKQHVRTSQ